MKMKKVVYYLAMILVLVSCSLDDSPKSEPVSLPIESVIMPTVWPVDQLGAIKITYRRPTTCHLFNGFNYQINDDFTRTVSIEAVKLNDNNCIDASEESYEVELNFKPTQLGIYHFKFWTGVDSSGNYTFLEYDVEAQ
jgi:hypothetical protein